MKSSEGIKQTSGKAVLIYDGSCPICRNTVAWIKQNEVKNAFQMVSCQSQERKEIYADIEEAACMDAMQLVLPDGEVLAGEKALPEIFKRLKRYQAAAALFKLPGSTSLARSFYRWFADRRYFIARILFPSKDHDRPKKAA